MRRAMLQLIVVVALLGPASPALAGGFATVRLDEAPGEILVEVPWRFGFMVRQHDVTPTNDVTPVVRARHKETGEEVTATGRQDGAVGHFVAELEFPRAGAWKWAIRPEPFPETSFETLTVRDRAADADAEAGPGAASGPPIHPAAITAGSCAAPGDTAFPLTDVEAQPIADASSAAEPSAASRAPVPVAVSVSTVDAALPDLAATGHAITVSISAEDDTPVACGDVAGVTGAGELVLGLQQRNDSGDVGVAVLRSKGERTEVTLYLVVAGAKGAASAAVEASTVEIVGGPADASTFQPAALTVAPGTAVTWVNHSDAAHTVTGDDLAFDDSGLIDPDQSFSRTFEEPGAFRYRCGPHPWMEGVIVVE